MLVQQQVVLTMMSNATMPQALIARVATPAVCIKGLKTYTRQCFNNRHQSAERFRVEPAGSNNPRHRPVLERMSLLGHAIITTTKEILGLD